MNWAKGFLNQSKGFWFGKNSLYKDIENSVNNKKMRDVEEFATGFINDLNPQVEATVDPKTIAMIAVTVFALYSIA